MAIQHPAESRIITENGFGGSVVYKLPAGGWSIFTIFYFSFAVIWNTVTYNTLYIPGVAPDIMFYSFAPIGLFMFIAFVYHLAMRVEITIRDGFISFSRILLGLRFTKRRSIKEIESIGQGIAYLRNYQPVYGIQLLFNTSGKIVFGSHLLHHERTWLINELNRVTGAGR